MKKATIIYYDDKYFKVVLSHIDTLMMMGVVTGYETYSDQSEE